eukprot:gene10316-10474_t
MTLAEATKRLVELHDTTLRHLHDTIREHKCALHGLIEQAQEELTALGRPVALVCGQVARGNVQGSGLEAGDASPNIKHRAAAAAISADDEGNAVNRPVRRGRGRPAKQRQPPAAIAEDDEVVVAAIAAASTAGHEQQACSQDSEQPSVSATIRASALEVAEVEAGDDAISLPICGHRLRATRSRAAAMCMTAGTSKAEATNAAPAKSGSRKRAAGAAAPSASCSTRSTRRRGAAAAEAVLPAIDEEEKEMQDVDDVQHVEKAALTSPAAQDMAAANDKAEAAAYLAWYQAEQGRFEQGPHTNPPSSAAMQHSMRSQQQILPAEAVAPASNPAVDAVDEASGPCSAPDEEMIPSSVSKSGRLSSLKVPSLSFGEGLQGALLQEQHQPADIVGPALKPETAAAAESSKSLESKAPGGPSSSETAPDEGAAQGAAAWKSLVSSMHASDGPTPAAHRSRQRTRSGASAEGHGGSQGSAMQAAAVMAADGGADGRAVVGSSVQRRSTRASTQRPHSPLGHVISEARDTATTFAMEQEHQPQCQLPVLTPSALRLEQQQQQDASSLKLRTPRSARRSKVGLEAALEAAAAEKEEQDALLMQHQQRLKLATLACPAAGDDAVQDAAEDDDVFVDGADWVMGTDVAHLQVKALEAALAAKQAEEAPTPAGAAACTKIAAVERAAAGLSGSGGAVRVVVAGKEASEEERAHNADKDAAQKKAEKEAEAAKRAMDKTEREERMKRAEQKRKEDEAKRRAELAEKQRLKLERAAAAVIAAKGQKAAAGGGAAWSSAAAADGKAVASKQQHLPAATTTSDGVIFKTPAPPKASARTGGGVGVDNQHATVVWHLLVPTLSSLQERRNIEVLKSSPYVNPGSKRTPAQQPSYMISPFRDDDEDTPDRSHKPIPDWARSQALFEAVKAQQHKDPDTIFGQRQTTCDLGELFADVPQVPAAAHHRHKVRKLGQRSSSADWSQDRLTWQEEISYKKSLGYL